MSFGFGLGFPKNRPFAGGPSLNFQFVGSTTLDSSITFTRASSATMFDSSGTLVYAPMNLLLWSEDFSQAAWTKQSSVSVATNTTVAPNGTTTGDTVTADVGFGVYQQISVTVGTRVTQSVYIRAGTATAIMFRDDTGAGRHIVVNPSTGVVTSTSGTLINFGSISVGNSWYRIYFSYVADATVVRGIVRPDNAGAGQTFIVWGGQTNLFSMLGGVTASLSTYYPTTTAAYQAPRFDYNPATLASRGLLIEEQRTNSIRNNTMQGAVAPSTFPTNWQSIIVAGLTATVVGTGTQNGITYLDVRVNGTPSVSTYYNLVPDILVAGASGQTWTGGFWLSLISGSLTNTNCNIEIRESDAAQGFLANTLTLLPVTSTLTRYSQTRTLNNASTAFVSVRSVWQLTSGLPVDFTLRIGLPQLEQGAFATSVIPTTTTAATRNADVASVNTLSPWFNASEGTLYAEVQAAAGFNVAGLFGRYAAIQDALNNNSVEMFFDGPVAGAPRYRVRSGGVNQAVGSSAIGYTANTTLKASLAYKVNDFAGVSRGVVDLTDTSGVVPVGPTFLSLGSEGGSSNYLNGWLRTVTYYPRRLANAELQTITLPTGATITTQDYSLDTNFVGNTVAIGS